jgi:hypothetical protein
MMKFNINKMHGMLLGAFEEVSILEKSSKEFGNFFEISAKFEGKQIRMNVSKSSLERDSFGWSYYSDPTDDSSYMIERSSTIDGIAEDMMDIFEKRRFCEEYLSKLEA